MSYKPDTLKPAFLYAGKCASLTIQPVPIMIIGLVLLGIGQVWLKFLINVS